jgi:hypothetical protein
MDLYIFQFMFYILSIVMKCGRYLTEATHCSEIVENYCNGAEFVTTY